MQPKAPHAECDKCPLRNRPMVPGHGATPDKATMVIVGEAPGRNEAQYAVPFIGQSGQLLRGMLQMIEVDGGYAKVPGLNAPMDAEFSVDVGTVYYTNCCLCQPPGNKIPPVAAKKCSKRLAYELKPYWDAGLPIGALGVTAGEILVGHSDKSLRGKWYRDGRIVCTWHPAYVIRVADKMQNRFSELLLDLKKLKRGKPVELPYPTWEIPRTPAELEEVVDRVIALKSEGGYLCPEGGARGVICYDLETDQLMWWRHKILSAGFAYDYEHAFVIPSELIYEPCCRDALDKLFSSGIRFVGHNIKFDLRFVMAQLGVTEMPYMEDTLVAHHVLDENMMHGLKPLLSDYLDVGDYEGRLIHRYLRTRGDFYSKIPRDKLYEYNVLDVCYTLRLWDMLEADMIDNGLYERPYRYPMMASQPMLVEMELEGMYVDTGQLQWLSDEMEKGISSLQAELEADCGRQFNANSWKQVSIIMYEYFKMPKVRGRGFKVGSTCQQARRQILQQIPEDSKGAKWLVKFDQLKSLLKLKSSYVDNVWQYLDDDSRVHPDGLIYGTESGRLSFRDPPIQTIPRPGTGEVEGEVWGQYIRGYYSAPEGYKIVEVDISQAEMRVACALSEEPFLHDIYEHGKDLHTMVAVEMYGENFTKDQRNACKKFNFAYLYGGTEHSFALEEGMNIQLAKDFVRRYKRVMPVLTSWKDSMLTELKSKGYVETRTGRRRRFPVITNDNWDAARKAAVNMPVQGMASEVTLITAIDTWKYLKEMDYWGEEGTLISLIHDSVLLIVRDDYVSEISYEVQRMMREVGERWVPEVPWKVDIDVGQDWGHLKDISQWPEFVRSVEKSTTNVN